MRTTPSLDGWDIGAVTQAEWIPWGSTGDARAKVLAGGDGYTVALVEADAGYTGTPHEHEHTEMLYVVAGRLRNQGRLMEPGDAYVASAGSTHEDFEAEVPSTYLSIFRL